MLKFGDKTITLNWSSVVTRRIGGADRQAMDFNVTASYADVSSLFVDGAVYSDEVTVDDAVQSTDLSEYCLAGKIIDNRDGTFTVSMGQKTAEELAAAVALKAKTDAETALADAQTALADAQSKYSALADKIKTAMSGSAIIKAALEKLGIEV
jgi:hypothetical protein